MNPEQHWGRMRGGEYVRSDFGAYCIYPAVSPRPAQPPLPLAREWFHSRFTPKQMTFARFSIKENRIARSSPGHSNCGNTHGAGHAAFGF